MQRNIPSCALMGAHTQFRRRSSPGGLCQVSEMCSAALAGQHAQHFCNMLCVLQWGGVQDSIIAGPAGMAHDVVVYCVPRLALQRD